MSALVFITPHVLSIQVEAPAPVAARLQHSDSPHIDPYYGQVYKVLKILS